MVQRITYTRRHSYNTKSNQVKIIKTPGGKLVFQYTKKAAAKPRCGDCKGLLQGIPALRPKEHRRTKKRQRRVSRAYGGSRCYKCVRSRIVRAFLIEEAKIVKKVVRERKVKK
mmetsp:Transcript_39860/g.85024  ORF Transcript_39860/g.85024 Transcript_39860/m.85024 type:complete len:113 (-) Transcript_39860:186-524(-)|eukprot:CAMPEP_0183347572 /NCGR_PEP_ID=MMETSP0164_2-20130417/12361_1 /TAXON_ID=221442 /ORGANISM="Coccolithus pelagicus ssp braarudi, Strain PLY182g" /LENGTH=112 /DNA_ID=CAMNT_0025519025 /DNA_START=65 /DNA_END=403 /DNA_ORIENTATION=-